MTPLEIWQRGPHHDHEPAMLAAPRVRLSGWFFLPQPDTAYRNLHGLPLSEDGHTTGESVAVVNVVQHHRGAFFTHSITPGYVLVLPPSESAYTAKLVELHIAHQRTLPAVFCQLSFEHWLAAYELFTQPQWSMADAVLMAVPWGMSNETLGLLARALAPNEPIEVTSS